MMLRRKPNRSSGHHGHVACTTASSKSNEAIHVKNFMRSIDPALRGNQLNHPIIPSSPPPASASASTKSASLPFFPDPESFDVEPPSRTSISLSRRSKGIEKHSSPSVSSISSASSLFPSPPSSLFYSSNRLRLKLNAVTVPCPRKTLFLSPTRAMARPANAYSNATNYNENCEAGQDGNGFGAGDSNNASLLKQLSQETRSNVIPLPQENTTKIDNKNKNHSIDFTNNIGGYYAFHNNPSDGLFEADPPAIGRNSSHVLLQSPCTPKSTIPTLALSTPAKNFGLITGASGRSSPNNQVPATVTNPVNWYNNSFVPTSTTTTTVSTPKRVSIDTAGENKSPNTLADTDGKNADTPTESVRKLVISAPILRPQPSVGTAMAASALVSMMETALPQQDNNRNPKRTLGVKIVGCASPMKKFRMTPHRISNFLNEAPIASVDKLRASRKKDEDEENCKSLSNLSDHSAHSLFQKSNEKSLRVDSEISNSKSKSAFCKSRRKSAATISESRGAAAPSASVSKACGPFKRIPRRFIDDPSLPILKSGMRLAAPNDREELNSLHCFVRSELLEVFVLKDSKATGDEANENRRKNNHKIKPGNQIQRVGIRCVHCGNKPKCQRVGTSMSTFFPKSLQDIYRGVCTWQRIHFQACKHIPNELKELYKHLKDSDRSRGKKAHWIQSAHDMGFRNVDENRNGIVWMGAESAPRALALDLTTLDDAIKASAEKDSRDDELHNV